LLPIPHPHEFVHKEGISKVDFVKKSHERVKNQIQQQTKTYMKQNNKAKREKGF